MGRRRSYSTTAVIRAARDLFWERGYELTSIDDLEARTGLDRSSLYHAFGSKQRLFEAALQDYLTEPIASRLASLRRPEAGLSALVAFFNDMAQTIRAQPSQARLGCLMVNTLGELVGLDAHQDLAETYRDQFLDAFGTALQQAAARGEIESERVGTRASLLVATTMGLSVSARIDPLEAARVCGSVAVEVATWRRAQPDDVPARVRPTRRVSKAVDQGDHDKEPG